MSDLSLPPPANPDEPDAATAAVESGFVAVDVDMPIDEVLSSKQKASREVPIIVGPGKRVNFRFEALRSADYEALMAEHPPTLAQRSNFREQMLKSGVPPASIGALPHNIETFPPALIAACCVSPAMTLEQAQELWTSERFATGELESLFEAAQAVNTINALDDLGNGLRQILGLR